MNEVIITLENGETVRVEEGTTLKELVKKINISTESPIVAAQVNNELKELSEALIKSSQVKFFDLSTEIGMGIYVRSLSFVFIRAAREIIPECCSVSVEHSLAKGLYCEIKGKALTF